MLGKRKLDSQGLEVSEIGLGCMGMTHAYGSPDDQESIATIHRAINATSKRRSAPRSAR